MPKSQFTKPPLTLEEQVTLLSRRGLVIDDSDRTKHYLNFIGYYRLSGYCRYFAHPDDANRERFRYGVSFQDILDLYIFDRKLRVLLMDAFERIEVAVKAAMSNAVATEAGAFWLCNPDNFNYGQHGQVEKELKDAIAATSGKSQHLFIDHFYQKYSEAYPPSWMVLEAMSFGGASRIYKLAKGIHRQRLSQTFGLQHDVLGSWLHAMAFGRNVCAHNARIWNRTYTIKPKIPRQYREAWPPIGHDRLYVLCCVIKHMMDVINDGSQWPTRLRELVNGRPNVPLMSMGFPADWEDAAFWGFGA